ncbi:unnamed protein product [Caenorhabditis sp. 36 PRJEB53466]|nr:unnamed protein product [Caenorhabditis sp. 36 PRJEB53466]
MSIRIRNYDHYMELFEEKKSQPIILYFTAAWCGPCQEIRPAVETLAAEHHEQLSFFKVDIEENEQLFDEFELNFVPTFVLLIDGQKKEAVGGADLDKLRDLVRAALN